jgi:predicted RNase H-related nuclease YkuK (DUF458 family)
MKGFKLFGGKEIDNLKDYVLDYVSNNDNLRIYVGTDSQKRGLTTTFATVICFRHYCSGAHIIFKRWNEKTFGMRTRLITEVSYSLETAQFLDNILKEQDIFKPIEYVKDEFTEYVKDENGFSIKQSKHNNLIDIDIDINPNPIWSSNKVYKECVGMVVGSNFRCRVKNDAWAASCAADLLC